MSFNKIEEAHRESVNDFLEWVEKNWTLEPDDKWPNAEPKPHPEYRNGYNAALEGMKMAFECYMDEVDY